MSVMPQPPVDAVISGSEDTQTESQGNDSSLDDSQHGKPAIAPFRFPFNPAAFAKGDKAEQPNYPGAGKSHHDKTPGRAPNGTRRSMGKR